MWKETFPKYFWTELLKCTDSPISPLTDPTGMGLSLRQSMRLWGRETSLGHWTSLPQQLTPHQMLQTHEVPSISAPGRFTTWNQKAKSKRIRRCRAAKGLPRKAGEGPEGAGWKWSRERKRRKQEQFDTLVLSLGCWWRSTCSLFICLVRIFNMWLWSCSIWFVWTYSYSLQKNQFTLI